MVSRGEQSMSLPLLLKKTVSFLEGTMVKCTRICGFKSYQSSVR